MRFKISNKITFLELFEDQIINLAGLSFHSCVLNSIEDTIYQLEFRKTSLNLAGTPTV